MRCTYCGRLLDSDYVAYIQQDDEWVPICLGCGIGEEDAPIQKERECPCDTPLSRRGEYRCQWGSKEGWCHNCD